MIEVRTPETPQELEAVRALMRAFVAWHRQRHASEIHLIDAYFDASAFEAELTALPGDYAPPHGGLYLAQQGPAALGCVAFKDLGDGVCEMKRMFVRPEHHGRGVGRALADAVIRGARAAGHAHMRLDTSIRQYEAQSLYRRLGFATIAPYHELPRELRDWLVFMELDLARLPQPACMLPTTAAHNASLLQPSEGQRDTQGSGFGGQDSPHG